MQEPIKEYETKIKELEEELARTKARNAMLESNQILLANEIKKLKKEKTELEKIIKKQDLEIQRLTSGKQQELF